jgi:uncharacterized protein (TIGR02302 family)
MDQERNDTYWLWRVTLSGVALYVERLWRALWPVWVIAGAFLAFALFDLYAWLPGWLHVVVLALFAVAVVAVLLVNLQRVQFPHYWESRRRLERVNKLPHRPLETLDDHVAGGAEASPVTRAMWRQHQAQLRRGLGKLNAGRPKPNILALDSFSLRFSVGLALLVSIVVAGDLWQDRLARAVTPAFESESARNATLDAWISPPDYTDRPPIYLVGAGNSGQQAPSGPIEVPQGSLLVAQVSNTGEAPRIVDPGAGAMGDAFDATAADSYRARYALNATGRFAVEADGRELGAWNFLVIPDEKPTVAFLQQPSQTPLAALRIDFQAHDDYGLAGVAASIRLPNASPTDETITFDLPLAGLNMKESAGTGYRDLTPHPWAGLEVLVQLIARDGRGQQGMSGAISVTLPERIFNHPVARAVIEQRKKLAADRGATRDKVSAELLRLAQDADAYDEDIVVFMALMAASRRLTNDAGDTLESLQKLMWDTALRIEDGKLSLASRELRRLQQELMEALARDAPDEELERLMDELQAALDALMEALAKLQPQDLENMPMMDPNAMTMDRQELQDLFDRMRELMRSGAKDAARQMLSELQNLMENLQTGQMRQIPKEFREGMEQLDLLQELMQGQQELLDRTYREAMRRSQQQGQQNQKQGKMSADTALQEALRRQLGEIMRQLGEITGEIPRPFGRAEGAMRRSTESLKGNQPGASVPAQTEALDQLREGARAATEQLMKKFGGAMAAAGQGQPRRPGGQQDPFGRRLEGGQGAAQADVEIPSESDVQKARRILEELRRRAGERQRPPVERDYIDRLLKPY